MQVQDLGPLWLTLHLAATTALVLLAVGTPLAWWLAHTKHPFKPVFEAVTALPLVLPPTVLGFYLLLLFSPNSAFGGWWLQITDTTLTFSFTGLVLASVIYSFPFTVQPLQSAFEAIGRGPLEVAATLRAGFWDRFFCVAVPMAKRGFLTAAILTFAHTLGEFGVVLMVGGNIPGQTRVVSIAIYEHVETLQYAQAHVLAGILLVLSFTILLIVYGLNRYAPLGRA
ncbi:MAG: molybdate ABC transporter permease subunit [Gammaproteobacteria bacterium]|nr:molybdate ABC transporter permease subunit [Gammaproteobacteria bacterium]